MPPTTNPQPDDDTVTPSGPTFKMISGVLKAFVKEVDGVERKFLSCTASSTVEDLHGDVMTGECVQDMAPQAKSKGMTIFLNHSYKVPEDVFGKTVDAKIVSRTQNAEGHAVYDLDLEIMLDESNDRALKTYASIKDQGMKLGVSIGAMIEEWEFRDEDAGWWGGLEIKKVNLLEASIVGIPANQRSWVINSLIALEAPKAIINKALGRSATKPLEPAPAAKIGAVKTATQRFFLDGVDVTEKLHLEVTESASTPNPDGSHTIEGTKFASVTTKTDDSTEVEADPAPDGETPDEADESTDDTDAGTDKSASPVEATAAVASLKSAGADESLLEIVLSFLEGATEEVASLRAANSTLTSERDQARQDVQEAAEIVELIAKTPLGRKAQFTGPVTTFRQKFGGYYGEQWMKLLDAGDND